MKPLFVSIPHSGERVPAETPWLHGLPEPLLMCDVDRYVDRLYAPAIRALSLPSVVTEWHRYVVDLNRLPEDIDADSVQGSFNPSGTFPIGLHWSVTTRGQKLLPKPMDKALHDSLVEKYFWPFHRQVEALYKQMFERGAQKVYQVDAHSMPSKGTKAHRDPGQDRPQIVVSDCDGSSCESWFKDLVIESYKAAGFEVAYNWPYKGGRVTQTYGRPDQGQHAIQVEMSRALYMDEESKQLWPEKAKQVEQQVIDALTRIEREIPPVQAG